MEKTEEGYFINLKEEINKILKPTKSTLFIVIPMAILLTIYSFIYTENNYQTISLLFFTLAISLASIQDFQEKLVLEILLTISAISSIFYIKTPKLDTNFYLISAFIENILLGFMVVCFMLVLSKTLSIILDKQSMGEGDYPIFFAMIILCGVNLPKAFIIMSITAILYKVLTKEETIPLIPFMFIGIVSTLYLGLL